MYIDRLVSRALSDGPATTKNVADVVFNVTGVIKLECQLKKLSSRVSDHETNIKKKRRIEQKIFRLTFRIRFGTGSPFQHKSAGQLISCQALLFCL